MLPPKMQNAVKCCTPVNEQLLDIIIDASILVIPREPAHALLHVVRGGRSGRCVGGRFKHAEYVTLPAQRDKQSTELNSGRGNGTPAVILPYSVHVTPRPSNIVSRNSRRRHHRRESSAGPRHQSAHRPGTLVWEEERD